MASCPTYPADLPESFSIIMVVCGLIVNNFVLALRGILSDAFNLRPKWSFGFTLLPFWNELYEKASVLLV